MADLSRLLDVEGKSLQELLDGVEDLRGGEGVSERLTSAKFDYQARDMPKFVLTTALAELVQVVQRQQEEIDELKKVRNASKRTPTNTPKKKDEEVD